MKKWILTGLMTWTCTLAWAQDAEREKLRQIEIEKQAMQQRAIRVQLDSAIFLTDAAAYAKADEKYRYVLKNMKSIPSDLTYHFGRNSYHLEKYAQTIDWLNKYIQLKGTTGQYSQSAADLLSKAQLLVLEERKREAMAAGELLSQDFDIDCGPTGRVVCPVCNGSTVVIRKTYLGESYKTCGYCSKKGYLECTDYNKLIRGQLKPVTN
jgi:hypothetical protein